MPVEVSVIVPTHNRLEILPEVLAALDAQIDAPEFELLVVDDGSNDGTADWLERWLARRVAKHPARTLSQSNAGPAAARNSAVQVAAGRWVAFTGDDTVPAPGWLAAHRAALQSRGDLANLGVLGYSAWHSRMRLNPFLRYINEHGLQFGYALIQEPERVPFNFFYTSNLVVPKDLLLREPFDLGFPYPAWEDIEVGYRLEKQGFRMVYEPRAVVQHFHPTDLERFASRQEKAGYSAVQFYRLHPELGGFLGLGPKGPPPIPSLRRQGRREKLVRALQNWPVSLPRLWEETLRFHYIRGLHRGWRDSQEEILREAG
ncbi:MAG: glycosyltransferase family 2 protein [Acidobacteriota bacterium]